MNTAEVAIEHVLTGLLGLCAFLLPLLSGLSVDEKLLQTETLIGVLGLAYLFGVVFDRLADTILSPIEQHIRLRVAIRSLERDEIKRIETEQSRGNRKSSSGEVPGTPDAHPDPFPQDKLEFSLRGEQSGRVDWMDSLRSRIRTCRGLAVFGLPAAMGIAIFLSAERGSQVRWEWWPHRAVAINLILVFTAIVVSSREFGDLLETVRAKTLVGEELVEKLETKAKILKSVKTYELADGGNRKEQMTQSAKRTRFCSSFYLLMLLNSGLTVAAIAHWPEQPLACFVIVICAAIATALPIFAWYRITETHMNFIHRKLAEFPGEESNPGSLGTIPVEQ
jgi:hypothetical protein